MTRPSIRLLGLDPSFANFGIALATLYPDENELVIEALFLLETENEAGKDVRKNSDDLRRGRHLVTSLASLVRANKPSFACAEIPHGSQSSRGSFANGVVCGALASLELHDVPIIEVQAHETKLATVGKKTASKKEMIDWATAKYPDVNWLRHRGKLVASNEHLADAVAVIHAGIKTNQFAQARALLRGMSRAA